MSTEKPAGFIQSIFKQLCSISLPNMRHLGKLREEQIERHARNPALTILKDVMENIIFKNTMLYRKNR